MASRAGGTLRAQSADRQENDPSQSTNVILNAIINPGILTTPKPFHKGQNIALHMQQAEKYFKTRGNTIDPISKAHMMLSFLDESAQLQLRCQPGYEDHGDEYEWIKKTLLTIFKRKATAASHLIHLLSIKQRADQSLNDYMTQLRVELYRIWPQEVDAKNKENCLVTAFINGLLQKDVALALQALKPASLEEAYKLAKKENKYCRENDPLLRNMRHIDAAATMDFDKDPPVRVMQREAAVTLESLHSQILSLQRQVQHLETLIRSNRNPTNNSYATAVNRNQPPPRQRNALSMPYRPQRPDTNGVPPVQVCYNCRAPGHLARNCPRPIICFNCGGTNHIGKQCPKLKPSSPRPFVVRGLQEEYAGGHNSLEDAADNVEEFEQDDLGEDVECCAILSKTLPENGRKKDRTNHNERKHAKVPPILRQKEVETNQWTAYILGNGKKPRQEYAKTLISSAHSEPARNKPVIIGRCAGERVKLFLDSGAEMNVIDSEFLKQLMAKQLPVKFSPAETRIQCANGSRMAVLGFATLSLQIGTAKVVQKFHFSEDYCRDTNDEDDVN